jgi:hypothetical protein
MELHHPPKNLIHLFIDGSLAADSRRRWFALGVLFLTIVALSWLALNLSLPDPQLNLDAAERRLRDVTASERSNVGAEMVRLRGTEYRFACARQMVKEMACGFRNHQHYKTVIYFHCGGLDLYPRVEAPA